VPGYLIQLMWLKRQGILDTFFAAALCNCLMFVEVIVDVLLGNPAISDTKLKNHITITSLFFFLASSQHE